MPAIDYSKFDHIGDSDEEEQPPAAVRHAATPIRGGTAGYPLAQSGGASASKKVGRSGHELLEPVSLDESLVMRGSPAPSSGSKPPRGGGLLSNPEPPPKKTSSSGRELLEPRGLDQSLLFAGSTEPSSGSRPQKGGGDSEADAAMASLAEQLERWAGPRGADPGAGTEDKPAQKPNGPQRVCFKADGRKKVHTTYPDGGEMVEEYDERTDLLLVRRTKKASTLGRDPTWEYEVGQPPSTAFDPYADTLKASATQPIFLRKDTPEHFQWRIRNLTYPSSVYSVTVDHEKQDVVVRTSNKKYFKRIEIADLRRLGLKIKDEPLDWKHMNNTLIISYAKPKEVRDDEQKVLKEAEKSAVRM
eukprot:TRINITY_DN113607_c0_g1_i1.p1 TRINITY_DN113607_c0_g1~~TRINITY_DN113607_c0_g1_i1.p1  ORF type:complete len:386 (+),score=99.91 TRINITY_DN113607_c0_g1_i1:84-1160(+)